MEGNRDSRRGVVAVVSGGLSRRRLRNSSRDSPDEGTARLRDRGSGGGGKMDRYRDRDRSGRSKRRREKRVLHVSSNRDDDDDESSEDSLDGENDDVTIRFPLPSHPPPAANPYSSSSPQQQSNHHHYHKHHSQSQQHQRKGVPKVSKPPLGWKGDDMIGVKVPRKARSAVKRSHECWVLGGASGVEEGEERIPRQVSKSPLRLSPASTTTTHISPSSSNASLRKKMKPMSGRKQLPTKISRAPSSSAIQDDIEIEVAEVLFGMTRQEDAHKVDTRELDGASSNEARSRVSSPSSISPLLASNPSAAPKRKKARPLKVDDESPASSPAERAVSNSFMPSAVKLEAENLIKTVASLQNSTPQVGDSGDSAAAEIIVPSIASPHLEAQPEATKLDESQVPDFKMSTGDRMNCKDEDASASQNLDVKLGEATTLRKARPPGKLSPDEEDASNLDSAQKPAVPEAEMRLKASTKTKDQEMLPVEQAAPGDSDEIGKSASKKQMTKEHSPNLRVDLESKDDNGKSQIQKQRKKTPNVEPKQEKSAPTTAMNMPMAVGAWQGGFPPFGYMGQVPSRQGVIPMDGPTVTSNALPPYASIAHPSRQKRCATHIYIAQTIRYYQKLASMNPFWSAATTNSIFGAKPYSLNDMPPSDATLFTNPMQAAVSGFNMSSLHDTKIGASAYAGQHPSADKKATTNNPMIEVAQRKQTGVHQTPHSGSTTNMLHAPAFIFPINQQQAADVTPTINRADATKSVPWPGNLVAPAGASSSAAGSSGSIGALTPMTLSFSGLPMGDAQHLTMMQNNPYPFPFPSHIAGSSPFRGTAPPQAMPYFLPSHMLLPTQIQPLQQQLSVPSNTYHAQQNHQKTSKCNGSSSSQKHVQQSNLGSGLSVAGTNSHDFLASKQRQHAPPQNARQDSDKGSEENPYTSESRDSQMHKGMYGQSFAIVNHHQKFSVMSSTAAAAVAGSGGHGDKRMKSQQPQQQNVKLDHTSPPAFTMPFTSLSGTGVVLPGLELSSQSQNHAIFQTLPEASRHGHHQIAMTSKVAQSKKHTTDDGKSVVRESVNGTMTAEDVGKAMAGSKTAGNGLQHSPIFSKLGGEANGPISSVLNNNAMGILSPALNVIQAPANGSRTVNPLGGSVPNSSPMGTTSIPSLQHQQQMLQFQKQQQDPQLSSSPSKNSVSTNSSTVHSNHLSGCSTVVKFPQPPSGFPQAVMQDGIQSQIKATSGRSSASISGSSAPIHKSNHVVHQQVRSAQWPLPAGSHQTQISFGMNSVKVVPAVGQHFSGVSNSSAGTTAVDSASNSTCKNGDGSSPRAPTSAKPAPAATGGPHLQQSSSKNAPASSSTSKQFPVGTIPSILGHPQNTAGNSTTKVQQQQQLPQSLKQQSFPQAQFCFTNAYMQQPHPVQSNAVITTAVATGYYQKCQADQATQQTQQQQLTSVSRSYGMVALPTSGDSTSDPARAMAAAGNATNTRAVSQPTLLHPPQFTAVHSAASGSPRARALVPAPFTYMSKPAPGGDNLNASWQPKKR